MNWKKLTLCFLSVLLVLSLCACGAAGKAANDMAYESSAERPASGEYLSKADADVSNTAAVTEIALPENQKLIQTVAMSAETEDMDALLSQINARIGELGGYVEEQEIYNGSAYSGRRYRSAELKIRIPAEKLEQFVVQVSEVSNIISSNKTVENITLSYVATQSRVTALETEQTRLLELLAKAESMADILTIEERLTDVRTELEQVTSTLRVYDNQVSYGTVHLNISEVREYTVVKEPETVWERIGAGFMDSVNAIADGCVEFFVWLMSNILYFVLLAAVIILLIVLLRRRKKHRKQKSTPEA